MVAIPPSEGVRVVLITTVDQDPTVGAASSPNAAPYGGGGARRAPTRRYGAPNHNGQQTGATHSYKRDEGG